MKKFLKILLISLASLLLLTIITGGIVTWLVFTPEKLTPVVRRQAAKYLLCQSEIGEVELTFFSTFPQFGLKTRRLALIHPVAGAPCDTLLNVNELTGIINIRSLIKDKELIVNDFRLYDGRVCVYIDRHGKANFDIFGDFNSAPDTTETDLIFKVIDIGNIDLNNMDVLFVDESMNLKACVQRLSAKINGSINSFDDIVGRVDARPFDLSLEYRPDESSAMKTEIHGLSVKLDGSMKSGDVNVKLKIHPFDVKLNYASDSLNFDADVRNLSAVISGSTDLDQFSGNIRLEPFQTTFSLGNEIYLNDALVGLSIAADAALSRQFVQLKEASISINGLKLDVAGTVENDNVRKEIATGLSYRFASWPVKSIMALIPPSLTAYVKGIEADGKLSSEGTVSGVYSPLSMPVVDMRVLLEKGALRYPDLPVPLSALHADLYIHTDLKDPQSFVRINRFDAKTPKSSIKTAGRISRLFSDMHLDLLTDADLALSEFATVIPGSMKITASGGVTGKVKSEFSMSQLTKMEIEKMKLSGTLTLSGFDAAYDSISVKTNRSTIEFALPNQKALTNETAFAFASISSNALEANKIDGFSVSLQNAAISLETSDLRDSTRIPNVKCAFRIGALTAGMDTLNVDVQNPTGNILIAPRQHHPGLPDISFGYYSNRIKAGYGGYMATIEKLALDVEVENDPSQKDLVLQWTPKGFINMEKGKIDIPSSSYPIDISAIRMDFEPEVFAIEYANMVLGDSDFTLSGKLDNVSSYFRGDSLLRGEFDFVSGTTNVLQLMNITSGIGYDTAEKDAAAESGPYLVPKGIDILLHTDIGYASYGDATNASRIKGDLQIHDGMLVFNDIAFGTPAADMRVTAQYITTRENQDKNHLYLGLDLHLLDIEIGALLRMIPLVDSLMPMLNSFGGKGEFHCAVETYVDSMYNVKPSTIRGAASIRGSDMVLMDSEMFTTIAKSLKFNKKTENKVDSLSVEFIIFGPRIDIYPFLIVMDKYKAVISGRHNTETFKYNISVVQSPLPFRLAVDVEGTLENWKPKVGKSKFPDFYRPASRRIVESKQRELRQMIRDGLKGQLKKE